MVHLIMPKAWAQFMWISSGYGLRCVILSSTFRLQVMWMQSTHFERVWHVLWSSHSVTGSFRMNMGRISSALMSWNSGKCSCWNNGHCQSFEFKLWWDIWLSELHLYLCWWCLAFQTMHECEGQLKWSIFSCVGSNKYVQLYASV